MDEGTKDNYVGDGRQVVGINSTNASAEREKSKTHAREKEREKNTR